MGTFRILAPCDFEEVLDVCYFGGHFGGGEKDLGMRGGEKVYPVFDGSEGYLWTCLRKGEKFNAIQYERWVLPQFVGGTKSWPGDSCGDWVRI